MGQNAHKITAGGKKAFAAAGRRPAHSTSTPTKYLTLRRNTIVFLRSSKNYESSVHGYSLQIM